MLKASIIIILLILAVINCGIAICVWIYDVRTARSLERFIKSRRMQEKNDSERDAGEE